MTDDRVTLTAAVNNSGNENATGVVVKFYLNGTELIGTRLIPSLPVGQSKNVTSTATVVKGTTYTFSVTVDPDNLILEASELNNAAAQITSVNASRRTELSILDEYMATADVKDARVWSIDQLRRSGVTLTIADPTTPGSAARHAHADRTYANNSLILEHVRWHEDHAAQTALLTFRAVLADAWGWVEADQHGAEFLDFHRDYIGRYESFRLAKGYPELDAWAPPACVPDHLYYTRATDWSCTTGSAVAGPALPEWAKPQAESASNQASPVYGYYYLEAFPNVNRLGKALEAAPGTYHGDVHLAVAAGGGEFADPSKNVKDPLFWAFHKHIDSKIYKKWESLPHEPIVVLPDLELQANLEEAMSTLTTQDLNAYYDHIEKMMNADGGMHH